MNYNEALNFIINKQRLGIKPGLSRMEKLLDDMGNPQNDIRIVHIAGTNGKGTVANMLAEGLISCGCKVGLFTSPWIIDYREQIQLNGKFISEDVFADYITKYEDSDTTEFELLTAVMYKYFSDENVDYAIVECGMGGKGDSTNAIETPALAVITSVSVDHTDFLGNTLEEIAKEKAGIIKNNGTVVLYPNKECEYVFEQQCIITGSKLVKVKEHHNFKDNNMATVKKCLALLGQCVHLDYSVLPARQEYIADNIMLDGAHNKDGALALKDYLPNKNITAVIAMMQDKDAEAYIKIIAPCCDRIITTAASNPRSLPACELAEIAKQYCKNVSVEDNPHTAVELAKSESDFLLICGSFYLARDVRKDLF